ncbi:bacterial proteasome activator family protein [Isoptericola cucumis]|uniref:Bacterial proteasome activator n=1 Tax=Isoptericola cucumis TaxID=1776856 RepID=A0ABQ2BC59_9MICO|nr:bacterial proteasome activator family protein [Isoptericola cucumis]GGI11183.1 peptidyl-prolyl cis-trans isomerase [Isoptericola cucumis]
MSGSDPNDRSDETTSPTGGPRVVLPDGSDAPARRGTAAADEPRPDDLPHGEPDDEPGEETSRIEEPAKVMRIGAMIKRLLDEVRDAPLDDAARTRLAEIHERSLAELEDGLSPDLVEELHRIALPFSDDAAPSDAELRVAQAQLVGWLEGLFHGIQTALVAQQMAAQAQLSQMRRALPPGAHPAPFGPGGPGGQGGPPSGHGHERPEDGRPSPGQYL